MDGHVFLHWIFGSRPLNSSSDRGIGGILWAQVGKRRRTGYFVLVLCRDNNSFPRAVSAASSQHAVVAPPIFDEYMYSMLRPCKSMERSDINPPTDEGKGKRRMERQGVGSDP